MLTIFSGSISVLLEPLDLFIDNFLNFTLLILIQFTSKLLFVTQLVLKTVSIALEFVSGLNFTLECGIFLSKLLSVVDHPFDVLRAESVIVIGNCDLLFVSGSLVLS